jgi:hypothetical protein
MAVFDSQEQGAEALDWVILRDGGVSLYWRREYLDEDVNWLRQRDYQIFQFSCESWASGGMHADLQRTLRFPSFYGHNLDALHDCLEGDFVVPERGGAVVGFNRFDAFMKGKGASVSLSGRTEAEILLDVFARASRYFLLMGRRFVTLVQSDDPRVHFDRLGDVSAVWNGREWLDKDRA